MPIVETTELKALLERRECLLGLDVGSKTVGLALSDSGLVVASPLETIRRKTFDKDCAHMEAIVTDRKIGGLIIGLPINMDGSEGTRCKETRKFADKLLGRIELPAAFWDERLSTAAVERAMIEADLSRAKRAKIVDKLAAAYILQGALDFMARA